MEDHCHQSHWVTARHAAGWLLADKDQEAAAGLELALELRTSTQWVQGEHLGIQRGHGFCKGRQELFKF